jgi:hypothetical protein
MFCMAIYLRLKSLEIRQKIVFLAAAERIFPPMESAKRLRDSHVRRLALVCIKSFRFFRRLSFLLGHGTELTV